MSEPAAIIDFNDSGLRCLHLDAEPPETSPGYALLSGNKVITGESARKQAYLSPQQTFNQFWHQLSLSPLAMQSNLARHNADLAFNHLQNLLGSANLSEQLIFAVPGSFSNDQLGILLGLAKAAKLSVSGLVDAALLSASHLQAGAYLHFDVQLHQLVVTELDISQTLSRGNVETFPTLGIKPLYDSLAHSIADKFIQQYRFDPLHNAQGEQQMHDNLPAWLQQLQEQGEATIQLNAAQGNYQLNLHPEDIKNTLTERFGTLNKLLANSARQTVLSHRVAVIPGFNNYFSNSITLDENSLLQGFRTHQHSLMPVTNQIGLVTSLTSNSATVVNNSDIQISPKVTHVLHRGTAFPLSEQLAFDETTNSLNNQNQPELLKRTAQGWTLLVTPDNHSGSANGLMPGDNISIAGQTLLLIEVT